MATHISANFVAFDVLCFPILFCGFTVQCTLYVVTFLKNSFCSQGPILTILRPGVYTLLTKCGNCWFEDIGVCND